MSPTHGPCWRRRPHVPTLALTRRPTRPRSERGRPGPGPASLASGAVRSPGFCSVSLSLLCSFFLSFAPLEPSALVRGRGTCVGDGRWTGRGHGVTSTGRRRVLSCPRCRRLSQRSRLLCCRSLAGGRHARASRRLPRPPGRGVRRAARHRAGASRGRRWTREGTRGPGACGWRGVGRRSGRWRRKAVWHPARSGCGEKRKRGALTVRGGARLRHPMRVGVSVASASTRTRSVAVRAEDAARPGSALCECYPPPWLAATFVH